MQNSQNDSIQFKPDSTHSYFHSFQIYNNNRPVPFHLSLSHFHDVIPVLFTPIRVQGSHSLLKPSIPNSEWYPNQSDSDSTKTKTKQRQRLANHTRPFLVFHSKNSGVCKKGKGREREGFQGSWAFAFQFHRKNRKDPFIDRILTKEKNGKILYGQTMEWDCKTECQNSQRKKRKWNSNRNQIALDGVMYVHIYEVEYES